MRWNGDDTDLGDHGYPVRGKYPVWFDIPDRLAPLLVGALSNAREESLSKHINSEAVKEALNQLQVTDRAR
jgi:hypothetical protein